jgi:hypothetical protein
MQTQSKVIKCKFCGEPIVFNNEIRAFTNWGGDADGMIHKDVRTGNTIVSTAENVTKILEEIDKLRSSVWEVHQKLDSILKKLSL